MAARKKVPKNWDRTIAEIGREKCEGRTDILFAKWFYKFNGPTCDFLLLFFFGTTLFCFLVLIARGRRLKCFQPLCISARSDTGKDVNNCVLADTCSSNSIDRIVARGFSFFFKDAKTKTFFFTFNFVPLARNLASLQRPLQQWKET